MNKILITLGLLALTNASFMRSQLDLSEEDQSTVDDHEEDVEDGEEDADVDLDQAKAFAVQSHFHWDKACKQCYPGCFEWLRGDGKCHAICNFPQCHWDDGDCKPTPQAKYCYYNKHAPWKSCLWSSLGNGHCDPECFRPECNYDMGDCFNCDWDPHTFDPKTHCAPGCMWRMIGSGYCDWACFTKSCYYDYKDCCKDDHCDHHPHYAHK